MLGRLDRGESDTRIDGDLVRIAGLSEAERASVRALTWDELRHREHSRDHSGSRPGVASQMAEEIAAELSVTAVE